MNFKEMIGNFVISNDCLKNGKETCLSLEGRKVIDDMDIAHKNLCPVCCVIWHLRQAERQLELC